MTGSIPGALAGVRVLDVGTLAAAPLAATFLGEFGAEVIKIEHPDGGDPLREWGPKRNHVGLMWKSISRNKKSITLDLHPPDGQELFRQLVARSDVVVTNFRPGRLERWNLGYDSLKEVNPRLVMLHVTGFGREGPYSSRPGFGTLAEALSGFAHVVGEPGGPPTLPPFMLADGVAALTGAYAVMFALYHRDVHGGTGQLIDLSLVEPLMRLLELIYLEYDQLGRLAQRNGNRWDITSPRNAYRTRDGKWVAMSGSSPSVALRLFAAIGRPELVDDPAYATAQARLEHADEIDAMVADWIGGRDLDEVLTTFEREQVAVAPIYDAKQMLDDPHFQTRGSFLRVTDTDLGQMLIQAPVPRLSATPGKVSELGPALGAHNQEIYLELLGLDEERYQELTEKGVI